jgi:hypothetical protein
MDCCNPLRRISSEALVRFKAAPLLWPMGWLSWATTAGLLADRSDEIAAGV